MTKESNEANNTSVDHPILIWLVSIVCILIAGLGAVMAVLNDQTVSELRSLNSEIARLEGDRNQLREELESDEYEQLRAIKGTTNDLLKKQVEYDTLMAKIDEAKKLKNELDELGLNIQKVASENEKLGSKLLDNKTKKDKVDEETRLKEDIVTLEARLEGFKSRESDALQQLGRLEAQVTEAQKTRNQAQQDQAAAERAQAAAVRAQADAERAQADAERAQADAERARAAAERARDKAIEDRDSAKVEEGDRNKLRTGLINLESAQEDLRKDRARLEERETVVNERLKELDKQLEAYTNFTESMRKAFERINEFNSETADQLEAVELDPPQINLDTANKRLQQALDNLLNDFVNNLIKNVENEMKELTDPPVAQNESTEDNTGEGN